jgi:hypothetical protein
MVNSLLDTRLQIDGQASSGLIEPKAPRPAGTVSRSRVWQTTRTPAPLFRLHPSSDKIARLITPNIQ